jgi:hypothetical protein
MTTKTHIGTFPPPDGKQYDCQCARCGSTADYTPCDICDDEPDDHDCGDDCCCCADPEPNVTCSICEGHGGWYECMSSLEWCKGNPLPGRKHIARGNIEWFEEVEY